ncbi:hypothetical protein GMORB2_3882 [Geosmithia morbida]|uniref:Uncharacterized protein n=1 Tax=Geosmithia morbida TaxID=1094350 RepID=A0A9P5D2G9_9HYPO|nr:uncharacterized protein GMORB2_3882 [Geosmithia morbida]KAF4125043.1 hypothetical protein GMORB2_3882 [Geosmithia morbida]
MAPLPSVLARRRTNVLGSGSGVAVDTLRWCAAMN